MERKLQFNKSPVDHYIQADILYKLYGADGSMVFSDLKPDDIENSLFMYHMRKLESRGVVERTGEGYSLTLTGARWVNFIGANDLQPKMLPRLLINYLVFNPDKTKILLSRRKAIPGNHLNEYLLPGELYSYGLQLPDAAMEALKLINIPTDTCNYLGVFEVVKTLPDGFVHHTVSFMHEVILGDSTPAETEHYNYEWIDINNIDSGKYERPVSDIVNLYLSGNFGPFQTLTFSLA